MSTQLNSPAPPLTGARQTMMSWARVIRSHAEVPEIYQDACRALFGGRPVFPYVVLAPVMSGPRHRESEKLLCELDDTLYVMERTGSRLTTTGFPWRSARDIEFGNILLYSWITLSGITTDGVAAASTIVFNLATERYFAPFINRTRPVLAAAGEAELEAERAKFDYLAQASFKFMHFGRGSLLPGEHVVQTLWQPEFGQRTTLFGWPIYRTVSLAHLTILTDTELILIWDDERAEKKARTRYGGVWRYIPLRHIVSAACLDAGDGRLTLSLGLTSNGRVDRIFAAASRREVEGLKSALNPAAAS
jgi:hypothetical protein